MPAGRPTKLTPLAIEKAKSYVENFDTPVPTIEGLALALDVSRDTINEWYRNNANQQFSDCVNKLYAKQGHILINGTLEGKYNAMIAKLLLSSRHNYVEKKEEKLTVQMPKPILELDELRSNDSNKEISTPEQQD